MGEVEVVLRCTLVAQIAKEVLTPENEVLTPRERGKQTMENQTMENEVGTRRLHDVQHIFRGTCHVCIPVLFF